MASFTTARAGANPAGSPRLSATPTARRAAISAAVSLIRSASESDGSVRRHSLPRTTKYRPSGVSGYLNVDLSRLRFHLCNRSDEGFPVPAERVEGGIGRAGVINSPIIGADNAFLTVGERRQR